MEVCSEVILKVITKLVHLCFHPFTLKLFSMIYLGVFTLTVYVCAYVCMRVHVCTCMLHVHMCMSLNEDMQVLADIPCGARML